MYNKGIAISYTDRRDLARRIVELRPEGYGYFRMGVKLSPQMQMVEYTTVSGGDALSLGELARELGMVQVTRREKPRVINWHYDHPGARFVGCLAIAR